jgi:DNA-binding NtrC family response regulator
MLRRQAIADGERARSGAAPGLGHHAAVARNRARAVAAAVEKHQDAALVAAGSDRPFSGHAVEIDGDQLHVVGHRPSSCATECNIERMTDSHYRGQMSEVARRLQIGRSTLYRKLEALGLNEGRGAANGEEEAVATARQPVKIA